jgi:hypothetical protein
LFLLLLFSGYRKPTDAVLSVSLSSPEEELAGESSPVRKKWSIGQWFQRRMSNREMAAASAMKLKILREEVDRRRAKEKDGDGSAKEECSKVELEPSNPLLLASVRPGV